MSTRPTSRPSQRASSPDPRPSPTLSPNDHVRTLVELLRPVGPDLARRWLAALTIVPADERAAVVDAVERRIAETYPDSPATPTLAVGSDDAGEVTLVHPPIAKQGYTEQVHVTYARVKKDGPSAANNKQANKKIG